MKCRSEPFRSSTSLRYESICGTDCSGVLGGVARGHGGLRGAGDVELWQHARVGYELLERALLASVAVGIVGVDLARVDGGQERLIEHLHALACSPLRR